MKKTVVLGASVNPERYSYRAIEALVASGIETAAVGLREGTVGGIAIQRDFSGLNDIDTVTLYLGPQNQNAWFDQMFRFSGFNSRYVKLIHSHFFIIIKK
jgi:predicted CoA-binding protein